MKIYCSGIGGIGLSAYAALQKAAGHEVLGSDKSDSDTVRDLRTQGIDVFTNQNGSCLPTDCDLFVYSEAIPQDAPERVRARECGMTSRSYFHALGEMTHDAFVIAVCGTHGKSTTTSMVAKMLMDAGKDPSVVVGTKMKELDGRNWRKGKSDFFVVEACEYRRSFHYISPDIVLMTNVDGDHFDAFSSAEDYREAFVTFLKRLPKDGSVIIHGNDPDARTVADASGKLIIDADTFPLPQTGVPGEHMRQNARLAMALAQKFSIDPSVAQQSLLGFSGTWRRMEVKGETANGVTVIDDYAHHPVEIRATLAAMKEAYPTRRIVCVFQPHTHDRTLKLYDDIIASFGDADLVVVTNVYVARSDIETAKADVHTLTADIARESNTQAILGEGMDNVPHVLEATLQSGDVVITMGAGDITRLSDELLAVR